MKKFLLLSLLLFLVSCSKETHEITENYQLENELKDCTIHYLQAKQYASLTVVRCPNSSTTTKYSCGKNCARTNVVLDGYTADPDTEF